MKIIKEAKETENLTELFGRKKKVAEPVAPAEPPKKTEINRAWDDHYKMLEAIRQTGKSLFGAGICFVSDSGLPMAFAQEVVQSWIDNYDELARRFHWKTVVDNATD